MSNNNKQEKKNQINLIKKKKTNNNNQVICKWYWTKDVSQSSSSPVIKWSVIIFYQLKYQNADIKSIIMSFIQPPANHFKMIGYTFTCARTKHSHKYTTHNTHTQTHTNWNTKTLKIRFAFSRFDCPTKLSQKCA